MILQDQLDHSQGARLGDLEDELASGDIAVNLSSWVSSIHVVLRENAQHSGILLKSLRLDLEPGTGTADSQQARSLEELMSELDLR